MSRPKAIKTTTDLREMLLQTIADVRSGKLDARQARTIAALSTTILHSAKLDLDVMKFTMQESEIGKKPSTLALVG